MEISRKISRWQSLFNTSTSSYAKLYSFSSPTTLGKVAIQFRLLFAMFSRVRMSFSYSSSYSQQMDSRKFLSHTSMNRFCCILKNPVLSYFLCLIGLTASLSFQFGLAAKLWFQTVNFIQN